MADNDYVDESSYLLSSRCILKKTLAISDDSHAATYDQIDSRKRAFPVLKATLQLPRQSDITAVELRSSLSVTLVMEHTRAKRNSYR